MASSDEPTTSTVAAATTAAASTDNAEREQPVAKSTEPATEAVAAVAVDGEDQQDSPSKTKRKNRCTNCRKKVGLTGKSFKYDYTIHFFSQHNYVKSEHYELHFVLRHLPGCELTLSALVGFQCRCGGLFCSLHRYSDKHDCSFDYKAEGQAEIRKNNPVIVRDKVQKI